MGLKRRNSAEQLRNCSAELHHICKFLKYAVFSMFKKRRIWWNLGKFTSYSGFSSIKSTVNFQNLQIWCNSVDLNRNCSAELRIKM